MFSLHQSLLLNGIGCLHNVETTRRGTTGVLGLRFIEWVDRVLIHDIESMDLVVLGLSLGLGRYYMKFTLLLFCWFTFFCWLLWPLYLSLDGAMRIIQIHYGFSLLSGVVVKQNVFRKYLSLSRTKGFRNRLARWLTFIIVCSFFWTLYLFSRSRIRCY